MIEAMQLRKPSDHEASSTIQPMQLQKTKSDEAVGRRYARHEYYNRTFDQELDEEFLYATKRTTRSQLGERQKKSQLSKMVWAMVCVIFVITSGSSWIVFSETAQFSDVHKDSEPMIITRPAGAVTETTAEKTETVDPVAEETDTKSEPETTDLTQDVPYEYVEVNRDYLRN